MVKSVLLQTHKQPDQWNTKVQKKSQYVYLLQNGGFFKQRGKTRSLNNGTGKVS